MYKILLKDGTEITEGESEQTWQKTPPEDMDSVALCTEQGKILVKIERPESPPFLEFIQYRTAHVISGQPTQVVTQAMGWTDGTYEYMVVLDLANNRLFFETNERTHFHMLSHNQKPGAGAIMAPPSE